MKFVEIDVSEILYGKNIAYQSFSRCSSTDIERIRRDLGALYRVHYEIDGNLVLYLIWEPIGEPIMILILEDVQDPGIGVRIEISRDSNIQGRVDGGPNSDDANRVGRVHLECRRNCFPVNYSGQGGLDVLHIGESYRTRVLYGNIPDVGVRGRISTEVQACRQHINGRISDLERKTEFMYLLNNSGKLNDSWRKRFPPSVEMTASFVIPNECEESRFMLRIS